MEPASAPGQCSTGTADHDCTGANKSAFITALYVPVVPLLQLLILRSAPHPMACAGILLAFAGLLLLTAPEAGQIAGFGASAGELLTLAGAVSIAAEILLIGRFAGNVDLKRVTVVQLWAASLAAFGSMPLVGESMPSFALSWTGAAIALGAASVLIQLVMNWAQKTVSPVRATLIYASEPIWGGLVGRLAGDRIPSAAAFGAALIVLGVVVSELRPRLRGSEAPR